MSVHMLLNPKPFTSPLSTPPSLSLSSSHNTSFFHSPLFPNQKSKHTHHLLSISAKSDPTPNPNPNPNPNPKIKPKSKQKSSSPNPDETFPKTIPRKPRRGRKSEAAAVEDFVREKLEETFESIRQQNPQTLEDKQNVLKKKDDRERKNNAVVEQEDPNWPLDADIGWGIRSSEYFDKHSIKNVVGEDGFEIDWEGEVEDNYVKEINCLEWESFAFHPSPLIVLVFERYNRASVNWKYLKELEKAIKVYWNAKDRLPPRTVKIDINIERDMAYALKVKECPQLLFLRGNKILYRERDIRTADELVQMIAHFYYNAKKPSWVDDAAVLPP